LVVTASWAASSAVGAACGGASISLRDYAGPPDAQASPADDASVAEAAAPPTCQSCVHDGDCASMRCVLFGGDGYCMPACGADGSCASDRACVQMPDVAGTASDVCAPRSAACGTPSPPPDAGPKDPAQICGHLVGPTIPAGCGSSCSGSGPNRCQANGCSGGKWCNTDTNKCTSPPQSSNSCGNHGPGVTYDGGAPATGTISGNGGKASRLYFAIIGDTRPPSPDDTPAYPTDVITRIFSDVEALSPRPLFGISTGDYMFASTTGNEVDAQLDLYLAARQKYSGLVFPTMGNHECTGATKSNCGATNPDGTPKNFTAFMSRMLAPLGQTSPSYEIDVDATDGSWTAKFLFVAANAWTQADANWFDAALGRATTYTFIVRHESANAYTAPGVAPSENIMLNHPYTLAVVGHDHIYRRSGRREIIIGNGGAPPTGSSNYGFGVISQRADGSIAVDVIDYMSGLADSTFHFAVNPDGSDAAP